MISTVLPSFRFGMNCQCSAAIFPVWHELPMLPRGQINVADIKLENSCLKISHYCCIDMKTFRAVWLLHNLALDGKLYLRDDKNAAFV